MKTFRTFRATLPLLVATTVSLLLAGCSLDSFLYSPEELDNYDLPGNTIPDSLLEQVTFASGDNTLYGYWVASSGERPGLTLLYCHGNYHHIDYYWDRVMMLHDLGVNVFVFDYRGYGKSSGSSSSEEGLIEDGKQALNYVLSRAEVNPDSLVIYGFSLGNVVSIALTAETIDPLTLIAEAPFASSTSLQQGSTLLDLPGGWLTEGTFNNAERIKHIHVPFLHLHGDADAKVRWRDNGRVVFDNAPQPKRLILIPGAEHSTIPQTMGIGVYEQTLIEWIDEIIAQ